MRPDAIDQQILRLLSNDGRATIRDIARAVNLSPAPVKRRISRMEQAGVIRGYAAIVDDRQLGSIEAFVEIRLRGSIETDELAACIAGLEEVIDCFTVAGDPDALLRMQVDDVDHLQRTVNAIRRTGLVAGTKTLIVLHRLQRRGEVVWTDDLTAGRLPDQAAAQ